MSLAVFLPSQPLSHVRNVFANERDFFSASSWKDLEQIIRREPVTAVIVDPAADGVVDVDAVASLLHKFPSLPLIVYVPLSATAFGAIVQLSRRGLDHVVLHRVGDSKERLQHTVARVRMTPASQMMTKLLAPALKLVPLRLARAVSDMFDRPHSYASVLDLAMSAGMPSVSLYRYFDAAKLNSPKKLLIAAKLCRGLTYLRDPGYSVREVATKLGYRQPRIFAAHVMTVFDLTPTQLRARLSEDEATSLLVRWIDIPKELPTSERWVR